MGKGKKAKYQSKSSWDLLEEAVMLLRSIPLRTWFAYYLGAIPFIGGLLFFLQFMTQSAVGKQYITWAAFWLALAYLWMKVWQTAYTHDLMAYRMGRVPAKRPRAYWLKVTRLHAANQWWGTLVFCWAFLTAIPFGWVNAYSQNVTILNGLDGVEHPKKEAMSLALMDQRQNQTMTVTLVLFAFFVMLNLFSGAFLIPQLLKLLLGMDTTLSIAGLHLFNSSFFMICISVAYLLVDPLIKAAYLLRVFYQKSVKTGEDLLGLSEAMCERKRGLGRAMAALLFFSLCMGPLLGQGPETAAAEPSVDPQALQEQIEQVLTQSEFIWRMPPKDGKTDEGAVDSFFRQISEGIVSGVRGIGQAIEDFFDWVEEKLAKGERGSNTNAASGFPFDTLLLIVGILIVVGMLVLFIRSMKKKKEKLIPVAAPVANPVDIESEEVVATDLPEDQWLHLARNYLDQGDLRLALRAYFLSLLAMLENQALIKVTRAKSNMDYLKEVRRRHHAFPGLVESFHRNIRLFERTWYGLYQVDEDAIKDFRQHQERMGDAVRK